MSTLTEKDIKTLIRIAKQFTRIYEKDGSGVCGIGSSYGQSRVQLHPAPLAAIADPATWEIHIRRSVREYKYFAHIMIEDVMFFAIFDLDKWVGLTGDTQGDLLPKEAGWEPEVDPHHKRTPVPEMVNE